MSEPRGVLQAQVNALEELVESTREEHCRRLMEDAKRGVQETVRRAHRENRARMRAAIEEQRKRMEETLAATRARLATRARQQQQRLDEEQLRLAWPPLGDALLERWRDPACRRRWILGLVDEALARLPREAWRIEHPRDFNPAELSAVNERIGEHCGGKSSDFAAIDNLRAGLRISAGGACVDGTSAGLLTDRNRIEAELLALLREHVGEPPRP
jgi:hypothetical protein